MIRPFLGAAVAATAVAGTVTQSATAVGAIALCLPPGMILGFYAKGYVTLERCDCCRIEKKGRKFFSLRKNNSSYIGLCVVFLRSKYRDEMYKVSKVLVNI